MILTPEPIHRFASNFIGQLGRTTGMFIIWFKISKLTVEWVEFYSKIYIYVYEHETQCPAIKYIK